MSIRHYPKATVAKYRRGWDLDDFTVYGSSMNSVVVYNRSPEVIGVVESIPYHQFGLHLRRPGGLEGRVAFDVAVENFTTILRHAFYVGSDAHIDEPILFVRFVEKKHRLGITPRDEAIVLSEVSVDGEPYRCPDRRRLMQVHGPMLARVRLRAVVVDHQAILYGDRVDLMHYPIG